MKLGIISGSHRKQSQSRKVGEYLKYLLEKKSNEEISVFFMDLAEENIPLWSEEKWSENSELSSLWEPYSKELSSCEGFIIISPEWGGMVTPALKNFFLMCDRHELAHKPAIPVSISAGINGAYPISEIRMSSYKNNMVAFTPNHIIVRFVNSVLNNYDEIENENDEKIKERIDYEIDIFIEYVKAYRSIRENCNFNYSRYPFGM